MYDLAQVSAMAAQGFPSPYQQPQQQHSHILRDVLIVGALNWYFIARPRQIKRRFTVPLATPDEIETRRRTGRWQPDIRPEDLYPWRARLLWRLAYAEQHDGLVPNDDGRTSCEAGEVVLGLRMIDDDIVATGVQPPRN